ncbi:cyclic pyranopterin monophosphate synthase [mine drainage metagenome]|uniref:Cyclic pyranopterin monophosphate synthase n=1 Tax=mine drainage metagenome TaxID=410659 RepID=A0A1J5T6G2_9ZZZZ
MPREIFDKNYAFLPRAELLSFEEIERLSRLFIQYGVQKIRLTGGEPLLRRGIERLIEKLARLRTVEGNPVDIALTTNAVLLTKKAQALKDAGLSRITVSLDGLHQNTFSKASGSEIPVATILAGIAAAQRAKFASIKVNMVVKRGMNEHEIIPMAAHFRDSGIVLRFIEYMDAGSSNSWCMDDVVSARQILDRVASHYEIQPIEFNYEGEVAERWRYLDGAGEIGVIASVTQAFCSSCTRVRLSTDGKLYTCLFASQASVDLREPLRQGASEQILSGLIASGWMRRGDRYSQLRHAETVTRNKIEMSYIGG